MQILSHPKPQILRFLTHLVILSFTSPEGNRERECTLGSWGCHRKVPYTWYLRRNRRWLTYTSRAWAKMSAWLAPSGELREIRFSLLVVCGQVSAFPNITPNPFPHFSMPFFSLCPNSHPIMMHVWLRLILIQQDPVCHHLNLLHQPGPFPNRPYFFPMLWLSMNQGVHSSVQSRRG